MREEESLGLVKNSAVTFSTKIAIAILMAVTSIIIARVLGPAGKGVWAILVLVPGLVAMVACLGLNISNVYLLGTGRYSVSQIVCNSLFTAMLMSFVSLVLILLLFDRIFSWIAAQTNGINPLWLKIMLFSVPLLLLTSYLSSVLQGRSEIVQLNLVNLAQTGLSLATILLFVVVLRKGVRGLIASHFVFNAGSAALAFLLVSRITGNMQFGFNGQLFRESVAFGSRGYLANILQFLNYRVDMFLVYYFLGTREVGYYSIAVVLSEMLWWVSQSVSVPFFPQVSSIGEQKSASLTPRVARMTLLATLPPALLLLALGRGIVSLLYGRAFLPAVAALYILLPGVLILASWRIVAHYFFGSGKPMVCTITSLVSLLANVFLNLLLIPRFGIRGAALATTISYFLASYLILRMFSSESGQPIAALLIPGRQDFANLKIGLSRLHSGRTLRA